MGWPEKTIDMERYYPNDVLVTGYDIIPFWVNRMTFQGLHFTNQRPFKDCLIHGLIRDKQGRKMSKSLGNGVDPMDVIDAYGADALRFYLTTSTTYGTDLRYDEDKVKSTWNFINKIWNASRFVLMNIEDLKEITLDNLKEEDKWILTSLNKTIKSVTKNMDKYEFNNVGTELYNFIWDDFCDNYIEFAKFSLDDNTTKSVLLTVLTDILKMLHPFMPYVTDEIYDMLPIHDENIMISTYPIYNKKQVFTKEYESFKDKIEFIKVFRNIKLENKIGKDFKFKLNNDLDYSLILKLLRIDESYIVDNSDKNKYSVVYKDYNLDIYYEKELTDEDIALKNKQINELENSILRRKKLLSNENYVNKAPKELVEKEKQTLEEEIKKLEVLKG